MSKYEELLNLYDSCRLTDAQASAAVKKILADAKNASADTLKAILSCIDLTSLNNTDTPEKIEIWAKKAANFNQKYPDLPNVAALCVYPACVAAAKNALDGTAGIELASVAAGFPAPQTFLEVKIAETAMSVVDGATEIDMVFPLNHFLEKNYEKVEDEIEEVKAACRGARLKVILETGSLPNAGNIAKAAILAMASGADFVKTSTGKTSVGATPEAAYSMALAVKEWNERNGAKVGLKLAGGISQTDDAVKFFAVVESVLGRKFMQKNTFRIGASRLANNLLSSLSGKDESYF